MLFNPVIGMIHDTHTDKYHPILLVEKPLPGPPSPDKPVRFQSKGHHTDGFASRDDAIASIQNDMAPKIDGLRYLTGLNDPLNDMPWDSSTEDLPTVSTIISEDMIVAELGVEAETEGGGTAVATAEAEADNLIVIVTSDTIHQTGTCSWKFMFHENSDGTKALPDEVLTTKVMNKPWGFVWVSDNDHYQDEPARAINLFQSGKGFLLSGGFHPFKDESNSPFPRHGGYDVEEARQKHERDERNMLGNIPACALVMSTADFEWLRENVLDRFDRPYERFHSDTPIPTS